MVTPAVKREAVAHLKALLGLSERRACRIAGAARKMIRYQARAARQTRRCAAGCENWPTSVGGSATGASSCCYGARASLPASTGSIGSTARMQEDQETVRRTVFPTTLTVRKRKARRKAVGTRTPILVEGRSNARWSLDFVHDQFANGQRFRVLNVVDDVTRECLAAIPDTSISGRRVARELTALVERRGKPGMIVSDNGTELNSNAILTFTATHRIEWHYIAPGNPMRDTASWRASTGRCETSGLTRQCSKT